MLTTPLPDSARAELTGTRRSPYQEAHIMDTRELNIGSIVHPTEHASHRFAAPGAPGIAGGIIVALNHNDQRAAVIWVDYRGPHREHCIVEIDDLRPPAAAAMPWWRRSTAPQRRHCTCPPALRIRNLTVRPHTVETHDLDLWFHTIDDANAAVRLIAAANQPFGSRVRKDRRSKLAGALTVTTSWPSHTDVYEIYEPLRVA